MRISLIAAVAENGVIGAGNRLPWHLPADLKHFRHLTLGHPIIMGRKNFESIGRPLSGRTNIVITRNETYRAAGCRIAHSIDEALAAGRGDPEIFVIGGAEIYAQALVCAERFYLTRVHADVAGDIRFPSFNASDWRETVRERHAADDVHAHAFSFITLERANHP